MRACRPVVLVVGALCIAACAPRDVGRAIHRDSQTFPATAGKVVVLDLRSLDAEVEVVEGDTITVEVELAAHSSSRAAARRWVERNTPQMNDSPSQLGITVPRRGRVSVIGHLDTMGVVSLRVPSGCRVEARSESGDVYLRGRTTLEGAVRIDTSSGDVTVRGGAAELLVDTESGDVQVAGRALDVLEAETASGDVTLDSGAERALVESSSGEVVLRGLRGDLGVTTTSGDVDARWIHCGPGHTIRVETASGDVVLHLAATAPVTGDVRTSGGSIDSELKGEEDRRGRRFTLGPQAGSAAEVVELTIRTTSGDVTLIKDNPEI